MNPHIYLRAKHKLLSFVIDYVNKATVNYNYEPLFIQQCMGCSRCFR